MSPDPPSLTRDPLIRAVRSAIAAHRMMAPGDQVLVALSGGPDSTALLHALWRLEEPMGLRLCAVHVHHGIRGVEADQDAQYVEGLCRELGIPLAIERVQVPEFAASRPGLSLEAAGRELRYKAFEAVAEKVGARRIALAHTADDQAETVILWLLRGTGLDGLSGIPPVRGPYVRPLLWVWRREVEAYCSRMGLKPREDRTNRDLRFLRNRIRHRLLPLLESEYRPGVRRALVRLTDLARSEREWAEAAAREAFARMARQGPGSVRLRRKELAEFPLALQRRLIRLGYQAVRGDRRQLSLEQVDKALELAPPGQPSGKWLPWPGGIRVRVEREDVVIEARY